MTDHRKARVNEILRTRLGGIDRVTVDQMPGDPYLRYAHIHQNSLGTTLYTDDSKKPDAVYAGWKHVGVIDLDTGDLA